jgi:succinate dehydrogenase / fumarate reductase, cytochrome b subunit
MSKISDHRPLSPHVGIYRWQITNTLSILHRLTGVALTLGLIPLTAWLWGAAFNPALFEWLSGAFGSIIGKLMLFGWTLAFYYHLGNGMRHLNWDIGKGFSLPDVLSSGRLVIVFALSMTIFTWVMIVQKVGM